MSFWHDSANAEEQTKPDIRHVCASSHGPSGNGSDKNTEMTLLGRGLSPCIVSVLVAKAFFKRHMDSYVEHGYSCIKLRSPLIRTLYNAPK